MGKRRPISDDDRRRVAELHAEGKSRNAIARAIGRAASTVSKIADELDLEFDRTRTAAGTRARKADAQSRRAQLALDLLADAERLRAQMWTPTTLHHFGGKDNTYAERRVDEPPFRDKRDIAHTVSLLLERHVRLVELDADDGNDEARAMLTELFGKLGQAWRDGE